jgi:hypothetical protein
MIANPGFDAGRFRAPADDAVGVCWKRGLVVSWPVLRRAAEEIAVDVVGKVRISRNA